PAPVQPLSGAGARPPCGRGSRRRADTQGGTRPGGQPQGLRTGQFQFSHPQPGAATGCRAARRAPRRRCPLSRPLDRHLTPDGNFRSHHTMIPRLACLILITLLLSACGATADHHDDDGAAASSDYELGRHGGRLLRNGDFALEVTIFESGVPPQYRLYAYSDDQPLDADQVRATVELGRLGGRTDTFAFRLEGDVLIGDGVVVEPHSFDVRVEAREG